MNHPDLEAVKHLCEELQQELTVLEAVLDDKNSLTIVIKDPEQSNPVWVPSAVQPSLATALRNHASNRIVNINEEAKRLREAGVPF